MPRIALTVELPDATPKSFAVDADVVSFGRGASCTVPLDDKFLSRLHAELIADGGEWILRDCGSANGTFLDGARVDKPVVIKTGSEISLGRSRVKVVREASEATGFEITLRGHASDPNWDEAPQVTAPHSLGALVAEQADEVSPITDLVLSESEVDKAADRVRFSLAMELIADRPMADLFKIIVDQVMLLMAPSRVALALLSQDGGDIEVVQYRGDQSDALVISRTLLREVMRDRNVISYTDIGANDSLSRAASIVAQSIYSALCAPLIVGESVLGVLYVDYRLSKRVITPEDAMLAAQIARVAAIKLESTRLRVAALEKERLDETLRLAQAIQMRMLPQGVPPLTPESSVDIAAELRPAKTVGGDFYDYHFAPDQKLYVCIGDVSGKGVPAALMMAVTRALFRSLILRGESPAGIMSAINRQLCDETDAAMFVTAWCAVLDLRTGELCCSNAGHNPPLLIDANGEVREIATRPGLVLGYLPPFKYIEETATLHPGDVLYLYTDGISEATNLSDELFSVDRLKEALRGSADGSAANIALATLSAVEKFVGEAPQSDDLTLLCFRYIKPPA
ncbi:MAG: SpoIIE family protein phosphatase [Thermoanaerobaculia bacterium]